MASKQPRNTTILRIHRYLTLVVASIVSISLLPQTTFAVTVRPDDRESIINESTYYDIVPLGSCGGNQQTDGPVQITGDNPKDAFNFFLSKGLTAVQAAGIIGNLMQESGVNPASVQSGGPGRGIAQWSEGGRWNQLQAWAKKQNKDHMSLATQLEFLWYEMTTVAPWNETLPAIKNTTTIDNVKIGPDITYGSTAVFEMKFEKAGQPNMSRRIMLANEAMKLYGGGSPVDNNVAAVSASCGGSNAGLVDGYSWPVAPRTKRNYTGFPCNGKKVQYTTEYGITSTIKACHGNPSPAYDLYYDGVGGQPIYAITKVKIVRLNRNYSNNPGHAGRACNSIQVQSINGTDDSFYWYGHVLATAGLTEGSVVDAGQPLGVVAPQDYGSRCHNGISHLHIDRGCRDKKGTWHTGGNNDCRDPQFQADMEKIYEGLPAG